MQPVTMSTRAFCDVAGITYRQADYWARTGRLVPSGRAATGCGSRRRYTLADARAALVVAELTRGGVWNLLASTALVALAQSDAAGVLFITEDGTVHDRPPVGVKWFWCVDLDKARRLVVDRLTERLAA